MPTDFSKTFNHQTVLHNGKVICILKIDSVSAPKKSNLAILYTGQYTGYSFGGIWFGLSSLFFRLIVFLFSYLVVRVLFIPESEI